MTATIKVPATLTRFLDSLNGSGRRNLFSVAANALRIEVQRHLRANAARRHATAQRLGASPTRHHEKGAARVTSNSSEDHGEVVIPIPGIGRAFHDVTISAVAARALTIPVSAHAYGHRVGELVRMGWIVFRPKGKDVLMGARKGLKGLKGLRGLKGSSGGEAEALYALKRRVTQRQDRSLLPSDATINDTVARAMIREMQRINREAVQ